MRALHTVIPVYRGVSWRYQSADCRWFTQLDFVAEVVYDWWRRETPSYTGTTLFLQTVYYRRAFLNSLPYPAVWPQQTWAKNGALPCLFFGGGELGPHLTTSPGPKPTSVPSGMMIHPALWSQLNICGPKIEGCCAPSRGGQLSLASNTRTHQEMR